MISKLESIKKEISPCSPPVWARTGHLQTIISHLIASPPLSQKGEVHVVKLSDGDELYATYYKGEKDVIVYLFHGLGGSTDSNYIQRTAILSRELGYHVFIVNHRGCGIGAGKAVNPYHSGRAEDLSAMISYGKNLFSTHKHVAVGFSLSANALLLLSAQIRGKCQPDLAIAVNAPINLEKAADLLLKGINKIYDKRFLLDLEKYLLENRPQDIGDYKKTKNLKDFDNRYTAPFGGFKNREDYYQQCSAKQFLNQINIPTVIISAMDDPFVNISDYLEAQYSDQVILHIEKFGGHIGYLQKKGMGFERWLDYCLKSYLSVYS